MRFRLLLFLMVAVGLEMAAFGPGRVASAANGEGSGTAVSPNLPWNVFYRAVTGTVFGSPCCIHADSVEQGQNGDCFLMSSLAAVASVSPETIQRGIRDNHNGTYAVTLYKDVGNGRDPGPLVPVTYTVDTKFPSEQVWPWTPTFLYARPGVDNGSLWPMLYEKAYAAMLEDGYKTYAEGGNGFWTMRTITSAPSDYWYVDAKETPGPVLQSVWIHEVPSVADFGGHSVIAGLFRGDIKAIEPRVQPCVTALGTFQPHRVCAAICKEGYACKQVLPGGGITLDKEHPSVRVDVLDIPQPGIQNEIASFELRDPAKCTASQPCRHDALGGLVTVSFDWKFAPQQAFKAHTITTIPELEATLTKLNGKAVTLSSLPPCGSQAPVAGRCAQANDPIFRPGALIPQHEYFFKGYDPRTQIATIVNPWFTGQPIPVSRSVLMHGFQAIFSNDVKPALAGGCSCK